MRISRQCRACADNGILKQHIQFVYIQSIVADIVVESGLAGYLCMHVKVTGMSISRELMGWRQLDFFSPGAGASVFV